MKNKSGFTIVELLIVIVVIGILAAISVIAYSGTSERSRYGRMQQDVATMNKMVRMFHADNGYYPHSSTTTTTVYSGATLAIPGLTPNYGSRMPTIPNDGLGGYYAYISSANGTEYKIVRLATIAANLPTIESGHPSPDTARPGRGWGIWSPGGSGL
ncbi:MAG: prepilin-type N-terminal cleavage/methylation domain-containing protein [Candidatus Saccharimonadales bacterium]